MKSNIAILLRTKEGREFLVEEKSLNSLLEFVNTFQVVVKQVQVSDYSKVLDLSQLTIAICDTEFRLSTDYKNLTDIVPAVTANTVTIEIPEPSTVSPRPRRERRVEIKADIRQRFLNGETVSVHQLRDLNPDIKTRTINNYLSAVRNELVAEGHQIRLIGAGTYIIQPTTLRSVIVTPAIRSSLNPAILNYLYLNPIRIT